MNLLKQRRKALAIQIAFWIMVGITSGLLYDLEWFIQHVVMFNGQLNNDLGKSNVSIEFNGATRVVDLSTIKTIGQFYEQTKVNTSDAFYYYTSTMKSVMAQEGMIFSVGALLAAFITGPLITFAINKRKNYLIFIVPILIIFAIFMSAIVPLLSSIFLLWAVFTPLFGVGYSYRTALDPWSATFAKKTGVRISFVRAFYEVGSGLMALVITQVYTQYGFYAKGPGYDSGIALYVLAFALVLLAIFIIFFMPNKEMFEVSHVSSQLGKTEQLNMIKMQEKSKNINLKDVILNKSFIFGLIIFMILIGTVQSFGSVWVNTVENKSILDSDFNSVEHIGYMKIFEILPRFFIVFLIYKLYKKVSFKTLMIITASVATVAWFVIGSLVYVVSDVSMYVTDFIGALAQATIATFSVLLGYEWVSRVTNIKTRNMTFVIFNTITYGIGGIIFVQINGFLSKVSIFGYEGLLVWFIMGISCAFALLLTLLFFKNPIKLENEIDSHVLEHVKAIGGKNARSTQRF